MKKLGLFLSLLFAITIYAQEVKTESTEAETSQAEIDALLNAVDETTDTATQAIAIDTNTQTTIDNNIYGEFGSPLMDCSKREDSLSVWTALFYGIGGGFLALFFPCTFPMIPMTMSFFLKGSGDKKKGTRNAILYGFAIFLVYFLLSLPFNFGLSGDTLSNFSTNLWVNLIFFTIFLVFAFSLFGFLGGGPPRLFWLVDERLAVMHRLA